MEECDYVSPKKTALYASIGSIGIAVCADIMVRSTVYVTGTLGLYESLFSLIIIAVSIASKKLGKTEAAVLAVVYLSYLMVVILCGGT